jgi:hypothetical protein
MSFWGVLKNIGTIMDTFKVISGIIRAIAGRDVKMPSCEEAKMLIKQLRKLLDSGVIDVPGIEEKDVSQVLGQIEERLVCTIDNADKELKKLVASGIDLKGRNL